MWEVCTSTLLRFAKEEPACSSIAVRSKRHYFSYGCVPVLAMSPGLLQRQEGVQRASTKYSSCRSGLFIACDSETSISLVVSHFSLPHFNSIFTSSPTASNPPTLRTLTYCPPLVQLQSADPLRPPSSMVQLIAVSSEEAREAAKPSLVPAPHPLLLHPPKHDKIRDTHIQLFGCPIRSIESPTARTYSQHKRDIMLLDVTDEDIRDLTGRARKEQEDGRISMHDSGPAAEAK
jgi:hypothetical protein